TRNASRIVVGKATRPSWLEAVSGSLVNTLVRESRGIDGLVVSAEEEDAALRRTERAARERVRWQDFPRAALAVAACTGVAALMSRVFEPTNLVMVYLLGVMWVAVT